VDLLDLFIILAALGYAVGGYRNGAVVGLFSLAGFLGGAVAGAQLGRPLASRVAHGQGQVVVALVCVLVVALVGQLAMVYVARLLRSRITWRSAQAVDSGIGALLGIVSVLLVAWMVAVPLASSPYPNLASQARRSSIVASVNDAVPNDLRNVYSSLRNFIDRSGFPQVLDALSPTHIVSVDPPSGALATAPGVKIDQPSVLKVYGQAPSCQRAIEGSGFVFAPGKLLTNAHVVAGTDHVQVVLPSGARTTARVVLYDPERDVAVLDAPGVKPAQSPPLTFAPAPATTDASAIVLGYPQDRGFTVAPARIRDQETITGHDIYGQGQVSRQIYSIRGTVISGNSGGPLITPDGSVLGIVFATALDSSDTGFVLTNSEIATDVTAGRTASASVPTGACA
jgi:S1-C subfamily serine protease